MFHTGSAHGIHPSERPPPAQAPWRFRRWMTRLPFIPPVTPATVKRRAGPAGLGFRVLTHAGVPDDQRVFSPTNRRLLPWGFPFRVSCAGLGPDFAGPPLTRLANPSPEGTGTAHASEYRSANAVSHRPWRRAARPCGTTLIGFLHRAGPHVHASARSGYVFTLRRVLRFRRLPTLFERAAALPEPCGST